MSALPYWSPPCWRCWSPGWPSAGCELDDLSMVFIVAVVVVAARTRMRAAVADRGAVLPRLQLLLHRSALHPLHRRAPGRDHGAPVPGRGAGRGPAGLAAAHAGDGPARGQHARHGLAGTGPATRQRGRPGPGGAGRDARRCSAALGAPAWIRIGDDDNRRRDACRRSGDKDLRAADWAQRHRQAAGRYTDTLAGIGHGGSCRCAANAKRSAWSACASAERDARLALRATAPGRGHGRRHRARRSCARGWSRTSKPRASAAKPNACARRCCRRSRTTCARRWRRSSVRPAAWTTMAMR